jgi:pimeloyl-ACP methyl ester carboxylesterase
MLSVFSDGENVVRTSDGVSIFYRAEGEGPTTLLFVHGWGGNGSGAVWDSVLHRLNHRDLRLVSMDLRGHGRSEHTEEGFTTERFADDILEVADQVGAAQFGIVAYSMSGRWSQWLSLTHADRVLGQVLLAPVAAVAMPIPQSMVDDWIERVGSRETYYDFESQFTKTRLSEDELDECYSAVQSTPEFSLRETLRMCGEAGFEERLADAQVPTLVVGGIHDPLITPDYLHREIVCRIPGSRKVLLDCGHNLPLELPTAVAAVIEAFIAGLAGEFVKDR